VSPRLRRRTRRRLPARFSNNGDFVGQDLCPPNSPNFVAGCFWTSSQAAFYVPKVGDLAAPVVRSAVEASGRTVNAICAGGPYPPGAIRERTSNT